MLKFIFDLFSKTAWYDGFIFTEGKSYNVLQYFGLMFVIAVAAYILGSINPAVIISKLMYGEDIRTKGSGNAGMTNIMRTSGKGPAAITFLGDLAKTLVAMTVGTLLCGTLGAYFAGFFAILGHIAPIYHKFRGGKGVSATAMFILYLDPLAFLIMITMFVIIVGGLKFLSLGSIICAFIFPYVMFSFEGAKASSFLEANPGLPLEANPYLDMRFIRILIMLLISFTVIFMHRANIKRLANGTESKFSFKKTQKPTAKDGK